MQFRGLVLAVAVTTATGCSAASPLDPNLAAAFVGTLGGATAAAVATGAVSPSPSASAVSPSPGPTTTPAPSQTPSATPTPAPTATCALGTLSGRIVDFSGSSVDGATITVKSNLLCPFVGTTTSKNGNWTIQAPVGVILDVSSNRGGSAIAEAGDTGVELQLSSSESSGSSSSSSSGSTSSEASQPYTLTGTVSSGYNGPLHLSAGVHKISAKFAGKDNFAIWLRDAHGGSSSLLFNTIGAPTDTYSAYVPNDGTYYIDVAMADAPWSIGVDVPLDQLASPDASNPNQPAPATASSLQPATYTGNNANGLNGPFHLTVGIHQISGRYTGSQVFSVWLKDSKQADLSLLYNHIGAIGSTRSIYISKEDDYYLDTTFGTGPWALGVDTSLDQLPAPGSAH